MSAVRYRIKGLESLKRDMKKAEREARRIFEEELESAARDINAKAVAKVPVDMGFLRASATVEGSKLVWRVYFTSEYAPYVEFGTGQFARDTVAPYPKEWQDHAMEFFRTGNGQMPAQPFFYPAVREAMAKIDEVIDKALQRLFDKL